MKKLIVATLTTISIFVPSINQFAMALPSEPAIISTPNFQLQLEALLVELQELNLIAKHLDTNDGNYPKRVYALLHRWETIRYIPALRNMRMSYWLGSAIDSHIDALDYLKEKARWEASTPTERLIISRNYDALLQISTNDFFMSLKSADNATNIFIMLKDNKKLTTNYQSINAFCIENPKANDDFCH